jgi:hypothetical protein
MTAASNAGLDTGDLWSLTEQGSAVGTVWLCCSQKLGCSKADRWSWKRDFEIVHVPSH